MTTPREGAAVLRDRRRASGRIRKPRFVALPVGQGDAFYLDREDVSVLVDGGRSRRSFGALFAGRTGASSVDVLICTHNDADHANGVIDFLESGLGCGEVWLPGRWLDALPGVLKSFTDDPFMLVEEVAEANLEGEASFVQSIGMTPLERFAESLPSAGPEHWPDNGPALSEDGWPESLRESLEEASLRGFDRRPWLSHPEPWPPLNVHVRMCPLDPMRDRLLWSAIQAACRIRDIAVAAFHHGIPVRWFEYDVKNPGGGRAELQPLNARAIAHCRPFTEPLLNLLALTVDNKESLVFVSPATAGAPAVLFTADSDLVGVTLRTKLDQAIVTAPHHGSEANANAYSAVATATGNAASLTWVRSDGRYQSRPGAGYLAVTGRRLCTMCRLPGGTASTKQAILLRVSRGVWARRGRTQVCTCM